MTLVKGNPSTNRYHPTIKIHIGSNEGLQLEQSQYRFYNKHYFSIQQTIQESRFGPNCVSECSMNGHSDQCWLIEMPRHFPRSNKTDYKGDFSNQLAYIFSRIFVKSRFHEIKLIVFEISTKSS